MYIYDPQPNPGTRIWDLLTIVGLLPKTCLVPLFFLHRKSKLAVGWLPLFTFEQSEISIKSIG